MKKIMFKLFNFTKIITERGTFYYLETIFGILNLVFFIQPKERSLKVHVAS